MSNTAAIPAASNLTLNGGVVELAAGNFARSMGTSSGQVQFGYYGGGFAAVGANRTVSLGPSSTATLTWGSTSSSSLPDQAVLYFGSAAADSTIIFQNPINLLSPSGLPQTVYATAGSGTAAVAAQLSGTLSGSGGLYIAGGGDLELSASNTYSGPTIVSESYLRLSNTAALPTASNLTLEGGVVELAAGNFARSMGTGSGQVQFTPYGGGFAAVGANRTVSLGPSSTATLTWGGTSSSSLPDQAVLYFGSAAADSTVIFQNPIMSSAQAVRRKPSM